METTTTTTPDAATKQRNWLEIEERGLKFSRFSTPTQRRLIGKAGGPNKQHIYEIEALHRGKMLGLAAVLSRDGKEFARVYITDKALGIGRLEKMAVAAFKAFLHAGKHRSRDAYKTRRREAEAARMTVEAIAADKTRWAARWQDCDDCWVTRTVKIQDGVTEYSATFWKGIESMGRIHADEETVKRFMLSGPQDDTTDPPASAAEGGAE